MICLICHQPATQTWHSQPICTPCRTTQRTVDRRINWAITITLLIAICAYTISH